MVTAALLALASVLVGASPAMANTKTADVYSSWTPPSWAHAVVTWYSSHSVHVSVEKYNGGDYRRVWVGAGYSENTVRYYPRQKYMAPGPIYSTLWDGVDFTNNDSRIDLVTVCMADDPGWAACETVFR